MGAPVKMRARYHLAAAAADSPPECAATPARAIAIRAMQGIAVHGAIVLRRHINAGQHRFGQNAPQRLQQGKAFGGTDGLGALQ
jgi:hypothetical protein